MRGIDVKTAVGGILTGDETVQIGSVSTDSRSIYKGTLFIAVRGERFDGNDFIEAAFEKGAHAVIGNREAIPPVGCAYVRVPDSVEALGRLAAWHREQFTIPVVGITGSVGKTTTKEMVGAVLSARYSTLKTAGNFNNHIGLPLTVLRLTESHEAAVIEMGMSARGEISYLTKIAKPTVAVITNVGLSHIETLKTQENIRDAKLEIAEGLPPGGTLLVSGDDAYLQNVQVPGAEVKRFGFDNPDCEFLGKIIDDDHFSFMETVIRVPVPGRHNLYNALAAVAAGFVCGISPDVAAEGLANYKTDGIRQTEVEIRPQIKVICDYYNASPASMAVALEMLQKGEAKRRIAVIGDMLELGEIGPACHREIGKKAVEMGIDMLFTVGPLAKLAAEEGAALGMETMHFPDNDALSNALLHILSPGDRVLIKGSHGMKMEQIFEKIR